MDEIKPLRTIYNNNISKPASINKSNPAKIIEKPYSSNIKSPGIVSSILSSSIPKDQNPNYSPQLGQVGHTEIDSNKQSQLKSQPLSLTSQKNILKIDTSTSVIQRETSKISKKSEKIKSVSNPENQSLRISSNSSTNDEIDSAQLRMTNSQKINPSTEDSHPRENLIVANQPKIANSRNNKGGLQLVISDRKKSDQNEVRQSPRFGTTDHTMYNLGTDSRPNLVGSSNNSNLIQNETGSQTHGHPPNEISENNEFRNLPRKIILGSRGPKNDIHNQSFAITFPHAGALKGLVEYLCGGHGKGTTSQSYFEISNEGLTYLGKDVSETVLNHACIYKSNTKKYTLSPKGTCRFFVKLDELKSNLKTIGKGETVSLIKYTNYDIICIKKGEACETIGSQHVQVISLLPMGDDVLYTAHDFSDVDMNSPNAVIYVPELQAMCRAISARNKVIIKGSQKYVRFDLQGESQSFWLFTSPDVESVDLSEDKTIIQVVVPGNVIKNLGRLAPLAPNSVIKVYFKEGSSIKISAPIEHLGDLNIYLHLK